MICRSIFEKYRKPSKKGLTLVEMIVTVAIVAIASGATLSVFLMVHDVTRDASDITVQQFYTGQTERMIRNEMQVASGVDIKLADQLKNGNPLVCLQYRGRTHPQTAEPSATYFHIHLCRL